MGFFMVLYGFLPYNSSRAPFNLSCIGYDLQRIIDKQGLYSFVNGEWLNG
jgi:hypothetical protein